MNFHLQINQIIIQIFIFLGIICTIPTEDLENEVDTKKSTAQHAEWNNTKKLDYVTEHLDFVSEYNMEKIKVSTSNSKYLLIFNLSYLENEVESGSKKHEIFITTHENGVLIQVELHTIPKASIYITMKNLDRPKYINVFFYNNPEKMKCYEIKDTIIEEYRAILQIPEKNGSKKFVFANSGNPNEFCNCNMIDGYGIYLSNYEQEIYCEMCDKYKIDTICKIIQADKFMNGCSEESKENSRNKNT